jgi:hypothetical protein
MTKRLVTLTPVGLEPTSEWVSTAGTSATCRTAAFPDDVDQLHSPRRRVDAKLAACMLSTEGGATAIKSCRAAKIDLEDRQSIQLDQTRSRQATGWAFRVRYPRRRLLRR